MRLYEKRMSIAFQTIMVRNKVSGERLSTVEMSKGICTQATLPVPLRQKSGQADTAGNI